MLKVFSKSAENRKLVSRLYAATGARAREPVFFTAFGVPDTIDELAPFASTVAGQLFAYYFAKERGCDVDQPRNLAKSVTVE